MELTFKSFGRTALLAAICFFTNNLLANGLTDLIDEAYAIEDAVAVSPFTTSSFVMPSGADQSVSNYHLMEADVSVWYNLIQQRPMNILLDVPTAEGTIQLQLTSLRTVISDDFDRSYTENGVTGVWEPGLYYKGIINGNPNSLAAVSFFEGEVIGVISVDGYSWVLGNLKVEADRPVFSIHKDIDVLEQYDIACGTDNLPQPEILEGAQMERSSAVCREVRVRFDADYDMYLEYGGVVGTENYITAMFNVSQTIFLIDAINMIISEIFVYTSSDPYTGYSYSSDFLYAYRSNLNASGFGADVAQLLSTRSLGAGGIGFLDGNFCGSTYAYSFSNIWTYYSAFPAYSWTVDVVTHELGHNLGSPHTHNCSWTGGAIDNCYSTEGSCSSGPPPASSGGTIMSYCHLTSFGKDFTLAFGPQPSTLILNNIDNMTCLAACNNCDPPVNMNAAPTSNSVVVSWDAVPGAVGYKIRGRRFGTTNWKEINLTSSSKTVNGLTGGTTYEWQALTACTSTDLSAWSAINLFTTSLLRESSAFNLEISPNPVADHVRIKTALSGAVTIEIFDVSGKRWISQSAVTEAGIPYTINNLNQLPSGVYAIHLSSDTETLTGSFVK